MLVFCSCNSWSLAKFFVCLLVQNYCLLVQISFVRAKFASCTCKISLAHATYYLHVQLLRGAYARMWTSQLHVQPNFRSSDQFLHEHTLHVQRNSCTCKKKKMPRLCLCKFVARKLGFARHHFHLIIVFSRKSFTMIHKAKPNAVKPRPRVTPMQRGSIIAYLKCGISVESICKETGVSRASVYRALKTWKSGPSTKTKNKKIGRPHKTTPEQDNLLLKLLISTENWFPGPLRECCSKFME